MAVRTDLIAQALRIIAPKLPTNGDTADRDRLAEIADELEEDATRRKATS